MPSADLVTAKVWDKTRDAVKPLAAVLGTTDAVIYGAAVAEFKGRRRTEQRLAVKRIERARGVRHSRVGRGNKLPGAGPVTP